MDQTRREMLASTLAAAGLTVLPVHLHEMRSDDFLVVFKVNGWTSDAARQNLHRSLMDIFKGTPMEGVKCVILEGGAELEIIRKPEGMA